MKQFSFYIHLFILLLLMQPTTLVGQSLFHQDIFYGGVTSGGFSTGQGSGSGTLPLYIEPGSTIRKAYLFSYRIGYPPKAPITVNGTPFFIDTNNIVMQVNHANPFASPIHFYYEDITNYLNANFTSTFNITIPAQFGLPINGGWWTAFIYIEYDNLALPKVATSLWINDKDLIGNEAYVMNNMNPMNTNFPVGLAVMIDRACNNTTDGTAVNLNSNLIGIIGNPDVVNNNWNCAGSKGHFYYQNNTLFGLDDDIPNNIMDSSDALANITSYLTNGDTGYSLNLIHNNNTNISKPNVNLLFINAYTTPCDTFSTSVTASSDTICVGESVQLQATGGSTYSWLGELNDTSIANPMASPIQSTTYIVTIQNDSGCVKTEHIKVWVRPQPNITIIPQVCGNQDGSILIDTIPQGTPPFTTILTNLTTLNIEPQTSNLLSGNYFLEITDAKGCVFKDTVYISEINNVVADFNSIPQAPISNPTQPLGKAPLEVSFFNTSQNANSYLWTISELINGLPVDTLFQSSTFNMQYFFQYGGSFEVCLIAYNNLPKCVDTICKTIFIDKSENITLFIPNVFTPNGDNENEVFTIQIFQTDLLESLEAKIFNRWGQVVESKKLNVKNEFAMVTTFEIWDGRTNTGKETSEGTYFYVISYTTKNGDTATKKGTITLLR